MKKKIHLSIPEPCHADWQDMTPQQQGRFCGSCQKTVVDFSKMSDTEVLNYFKKASGRVCGRFEKKQVNKTYQPLPVVVTPNWLKAGILASSLLTTGVVQGQHNAELIVGKVAVERTMGNVQAYHYLPQNPEKVILKGTVSDEHGEVLIGATIRIIGLSTGVATDIDGKYEFELLLEAFPEGIITLEVSYLGYASQRQVIEINKQVQKTIDFVLVPKTNAPSMEIMGIVYYAPPEPSPEKTLWQETKDWVRALKEKIANKQEETLIEVKETEAAEIIEIPTLSPETTKTIEDKLTVFPNPFVDKLLLKYKSDRGEAVELRLVDETGKVVFKQKKNVLKGENTIELSPNLPFGTYWLHLDNGIEEPLVKTVAHLNRA